MEEEVFEEKTREISADDSEEEEEEEEQDDDDGKELNKEKGSFASEAYEEKEVLMEVVVEEVEAGKDVQTLGVDEIDDQEDSQEKENEEKVEKEVKSEEKDKIKEEGEVDQEMEEDDEEEQLKEEDEKNEDEKNEEENNEDEDDEDENGEYDQKIEVEESSEEEIEAMKEEGGKKNSIVSANVSANEEKITDETLITKSSHDSKIEIKVATSAALDLDSLKKKRTFRKFSYRGVDLDQLLDLSVTQVFNLSVEELKASTIDNARNLLQLLSLHKDQWFSS